MRSEYMRASPLFRKAVSFRATGQRHGRDRVPVVEDDDLPLRGCAACDPPKGFSSLLKSRKAQPPKEAGRRSRAIVSLCETGMRSIRASAALGECPVPHLTRKGATAHAATHGQAAPWTTSRYFLLITSYFLLLTSYLRANNFNIF